MIIFEHQYFDFATTKELVKCYPEFAPVHDFVKNWRNGNQQFQFKTSGSTGRPKVIDIHKSQIEASVSATAAKLRLSQQDEALIVLDPAYIASIMMAARAMILDMDLYVAKPSSNPSESIAASKATFVSLVPLQIYNLIENNELDILNAIDNILIGGAPLSPTAFEQLSKLKSNSFITYGMTETVSHVALMPVHGKYADACFELLDGIEMGTDSRNCLWLRGEVTGQNKLQTNDVVKTQDESHFTWLGRADHIINSGGVKIYPESLERLIAEQTGIAIDQLFVHGIKREKLGQMVVLFIEPETVNQGILEQIQPIITKQFNKYHIPKQVISGIQFIRTTSGKIKREVTAKRYG